MNSTGANGWRVARDGWRGSVSSCPNPLNAADLARRYHLTMVKAHRWMRELPHWNIGRTRFTNEAMLAEWMAANVKNPARVKCFDPLEDAVMEQTLWRIGKLVEQGKLAVLSIPAGSNEREITDRPAQAGDRSLSMTCMEPASRP